MTTNAPVGPPICTRDPPNSEIKNPATTAVISPFSGVTPEAIAKAMDSGSATQATTSPALKSFKIREEVKSSGRFCKSVSNLGFNIIFYRLNSLRNSLL